MKNKSTCLLIVFFFLCLQLKAQNNCSAFYDAKFLKDSCYSEDDGKLFGKKNIDAIFKKYFPNQHVDINDPAFKNLLKQNPFFRKYVPDGTVQTSVTDNLTLPKFSLSSLGGIPIPNEILLGATDWIVKHTKKELSVFFFDDFRKQIEKYPDLRTVFPQTYRVLQVLGEEIYNYQRYLKTLRTAFQNDARELTNNLPTIITNHPDFFAKHPGLAATFNSGFYIAGALQDKVHPGDILKDYPSEYLDDLNPSWKGAIQTLQLISASLRDTASLNNTDSVYWVSFKQIKALAKDKVAFEMYLGLLYQKAITDYGSIHFSGANASITLVDMLKAAGEVYDSVYPAYSNFITHFAEKVNTLNGLVKNYQRSGEASTTFQGYYDYYNAVIDLLQHCTEISKLPFIKEKVPDLATSLKDYFDVAHTTADLFLDIKQHYYSSAITNTVHIYDLVKAMQAEKDATDNSLSLALRDTAKTFNPAKEKLFRFGSFMAAIAEADSAADVEKIIETFALPSGSSRVKRQSLFNVSLNAYAGLFIGNEMIRGVDEFKPFNKFNSYGVTAPIGVAVSIGKRGVLPWSKGKHQNGNWSHSVFVSLIDLGAVAAYRFTNDTAAQVPTVQLKHIFSPGFFWSIGIPKSPLSVNIGTQVGPNLRKIDNNSISLASTDNGNKTYWRCSISICVDLPVINFYTKSK